MKKIVFAIMIVVATLFVSNCFALSDNARMVIMYLGQPVFGGENFLHQVTGCKIANVEMVNFDEEVIYFSIPSKDYSRQELGKLANSINRVEFGLTKYSKELKIKKNDDGPIILGKYQYLVFNNYFFRIGFDNFRVGREKFVYQFSGGMSYDITLSELDAFGRNVNTYNGKILAMLKSGVVMVNHGAWVAKKEASLTRLVNRITQSHKSSIDKIQALLDFVNNEIQNNLQETLVDYETMKRPNEVLMAGRGDCSGKTTLLASLIEQLGFSYRLVYFDGHITLGVACSESFSNRDAYFEWRGESYLILETTTPYFKIGDPPMKKRIVCVQKPGEDIYFYSSGKKLVYR
ncbi:MAG: transglutaminase-like domain-containing protein [Patescibacteria group bacterium]|nr:transglutaminase-like domain-containing protein [Patescibacteria group bacterium]